MDRRRFLQLASGTWTALAGCAGTPDSTPPSTGNRGTSPGGRDPSSPRQTPTTRPSATADGSTHYVGPAGEPGNPGTESAPLGSIQDAVDRAQAGDQIFLKAGEYRQSFRTVRAGTAGAPITISGTEDAVVRGDPDGMPPIGLIQHSHVHLRGLTLDGLQDPTRPDDPRSYAQLLVHCIPPFETERYLEDIVLSPAAIGNTRRAMLLVVRSKDVEVGPTAVIGLAGAEYVLGDAEDHVGEIVYLGTPPPEALQVVSKPTYRWDGLDETRRVRVHHIDNSAGHPHSELVNTKLGTRDVLVEYCTSLGGSQNTETYPTAEVRFQSHEATLRWSEIRNGQGYGVHVVQHDGILRDHPEAAMAPEEAGTDHSIYGNVITGFGTNPFGFTSGVEAQRLVCGNVLTGGETGAPVHPCPADTPMGDGIGHAHRPRSEFPSLQAITFQFSRTLSPEDRGDTSSDWHIALRVYRLVLLDHDGAEVLAVDVGSETDTDGVVWGDGIYARAHNDETSWRFFGGADDRATIFVMNERFENASRIRVEGTALAEDLEMGVSSGGPVVDEVALVADETRWYTLSLGAD